MVTILYGVLITTANVIVLQQLPTFAKIPPVVGWPGENDRYGSLKNRHPPIHMVLNLALNAVFPKEIPANRVGCKAHQWRLLPRRCYKNRPLLFTSQDGCGSSTIYQSRRDAHQHSNTLLEATFNLEEGEKSISLLGCPLANKELEASNWSLWTRKWRRR